MAVICQTYSQKRAGYPLHDYQFRKQPSHWIGSHLRLLCTIVRLSSCEHFWIKQIPQSVAKLHKTQTNALLI